MTSHEWLTNEDIGSFAELNRQCQSLFPSHWVNRLMNFGGVCFAPINRNSQVCTNAAISTWWPTPTIQFCTVAPQSIFIIGYWNIEITFFKIVSPRDITSISLFILKPTPLLATPSKRKANEGGIEKKEDWFDRKHKSSLGRSFPEACRSRSWGIASY